MQLYASRSPTLPIVISSPLTITTTTRISERTSWGRFAMVSQVFSIVLLTVSSRRHSPGPRSPSCNISNLNITLHICTNYLSSNIIILPLHSPARQYDVILQVRLSYALYAAHRWPGTTLIIYSHLQYIPPESASKNISTKSKSHGGG